MMCYHALATRPAGIATRWLEDVSSKHELLCEQSIERYSFGGRGLFENRTPHTADYNPHTFESYTGMEASSSTNE